MKAWHSVFLESSGFLSYVSRMPERHILGVFRNFSRSVGWNLDSAIFGFSGWQCFCDTKTVSRTLLMAIKYDPESVLRVPIFSKSLLDKIKILLIEGVKWETRSLQKSVSWPHISLSL